MHLGYPVKGYGYFVSTQDCTVVSQRSMLMGGLPKQYPMPLSEKAALKVILRALEHIGPAPWVAEPRKYHVPVGSLAIQSSVSYPAPGDFVLAWTFKLLYTGLPAISAMVNATTGQLLYLQPPDVE
jgi:hypothetical protein